MNFIEDPTANPELVASNFESPPPFISGIQTVHFCNAVPQSNTFIDSIKLMLTNSYNSNDELSVLETNYGLPEWSAVIFANDTLNTLNHQLAFIPLLNHQGTEVRSLMMATSARGFVEIFLYKKSTLSKIYDSENVDEMLRPKIYTHLNLIKTFECILFGEDSGNIKPPNDYRPDYKSNLTIVLTYNYYDCECDANSMVNGENQYTLQVEVIAFFDYCSWSGNPTSGGGGGGGSSSGNGWPIGGLSGGSGGGSTGGGTVYISLPSGLSVTCAAPGFISLLELGIPLDFARQYISNHNLNIYPSSIIEILQGDCIIEDMTYQEYEDCVEASMTCAFSDQFEGNLVFDDQTKVDYWILCNDADNFTDCVYSYEFSKLPDCPDVDISDYFEYVEAVQELCASRPTDYGVYGDFIQSYLDETEPNTVLVEDIENMVNFCKEVRSQIIVGHLLSFGTNIIDVLDVAMWEFDYVFTLKYFTAIPPSARNQSINLVRVALSEAPTSGLNVFQWAARFGINSYDNLKRVLDDLGWSRSAKGIEIHHLIEQRFQNVPGVKQWLGNKTGDWDSIVLDASTEHQSFTNAWRNQIGYDNMNVPITTSNATLQDIQDAARIIYQDYPVILQALGL